MWEGHLTDKFESMVGLSAIIRSEVWSGWGFWFPAKWLQKPGWNLNGWWQLPNIYCHSRMQEEHIVLDFTKNGRWIYPSKNSVVEECYLLFWHHCPTCSSLSQLMNPPVDAWKIVSRKSPISVRLNCYVYKCSKRKILFFSCCEDLWGAHVFQSL